MLTAERRRLILERLRTQGRIHVPQLSAELGLSEDTIRRDLRDLAGDGLLQRVHGGALPRSPAMVDYATRQRAVSPTKEAIARVAAGLVRDGQVVFLDGGTTNVRLAEHLSPELRVTVVTHSPPVAVALARHSGVEVLLLAGRLYKHSVVAVGAATVAGIRQVRADLYMMGICSLHPEVGISGQDYEEAEVQRAFIDCSAEVVALASADKLGTAAPHLIAPLGELTHLVTEQTVPQDALAPYRALGIAIVVA